MEKALIICAFMANAVIGVIVFAAFVRDALK